MLADSWITDLLTKAGYTTPDDHRYILHDLFSDETPLSIEQVREMLQYYANTKQKTGEYFLENCPKLVESWMEITDLLIDRVERAATCSVILSKLEDSGNQALCVTVKNYRDKFLFKPTYNHTAEALRKRLHYMLEHLSDDETVTRLYTANKCVTPDRMYEQLKGEYAKC